MVLRIFLIVSLACHAVHAHITCPENPYPLIDGTDYRVPDSAFEASSTISTGLHDPSEEASSTVSTGLHDPSEARLSGDAWCSKTATEDPQPWVKVAFDQEFFIHEIGVAGLNTLSIPQYIINFIVQHRPISSSDLVSIMEANNSALYKIFSTNLTADEAIIVLENPIKTTELRIVIPYGITNVDMQACVRIEAYGCPVNEEGITVSSTAAIPCSTTSAKSNAGSSISIEIFGAIIVLAALSVVLLLICMFLTVYSNYMAIRNNKPKAETAENPMYEEGLDNMSGNEGRPEEVERSTVQAHDQPVYDKPKDVVTPAEAEEPAVLEVSAVIDDSDTTQLV